MRTETDAQMKLRLARLFIEREARQYLTERGRFNERQRLRRLLQWEDKLAAVKAERNEQKT